MDPRLAEIYGTNEEATDVEKTAAAELAEKLASEGSMDIDGMADEDIEALAQEVLSADSNEENTEESEETQEEETETTDKVAEADYLGRVMAHAYVQELKGIDKEAAKGGNVMAKLKAMGASAKKSGKKLFAKGKKGLAAGKAKAMEAGKSAKKYGKKHGKAMAGAGALGLAAGVAAGRKSKEASALDTLAAQRAREILAENGVELNEEAEVETEEKQAATKFDVLAAAVEARAQELLVAEGYEFEDGEEEAAE